ncbi:ABC transporter ATP-binding protein [Aestuariimicrobium soli]|uniref:ABC transporter ATP-binding protein n=1 Tax=Aestuariimicrobium soli TaxID=2035834 RepID=UPI003EBEF1C3
MSETVMPDDLGSGLVIDGLHKNLGGRTIVDNLSLDVAAGELVCLLGPSGCGKTTTLRMIAGFLEPDGGTVTVGSRDVTSLPPERRPSAMVFQNYALWPHMTVAKNVAFPLKLKKRPRAEITERVERVLALVNLLHHKDSRPARISGGEQQRTALARALVQEPAVLLLDEPLSNLDAKLRVRVREDIREIQQRLGITTVMVTHDQDEAMAMSDRVAVMNDGRIEQVSAPGELYANPRTEFVATFVGSVTKVPGRLTASGLSTTGADEGLVSAVRPEAVRLVPAGCGVAGGGSSRSGEVGRIGEVTRVTPHGHFVEVRVAIDAPGGEAGPGGVGREPVELVAYVNGSLVNPEVPAVGDRVGVDLGQIWYFRDGQRVD